jgi:hypothetical protein
MRPPEYRPRRSRKGRLQTDDKRGAHGEPFTGAMFHRTQRTPDVGPRPLLIAYYLYEVPDRPAERRATPT